MISDSRESVLCRRVTHSAGEIWDQNWDQGFAKDQRGRREWYLTATPSEPTPGGKGNGVRQPQSQQGAYLCVPAYQTADGRLILCRAAVAINAPKRQRVLKSSDCARTSSRPPSLRINASNSSFNAPHSSAVKLSAMIKKFEIGRNESLRTTSTIRESSAKTLQTELSFQSQRPDLESRSGERLSIGWN